EILIEHKDSTRKSDIRATKPVDRDDGSEIEAELEIGPYRLTYFKRFHRRNETRLSVTAPRPESLSGDPAHERVRAILEECAVDLALWKALRLEQGVDLALPELKDRSSLA